MITVLHFLAYSSYRDQRLKAPLVRTDHNIIVVTYLCPRGFMYVSVDYPFNPQLVHLARMEATVERRAARGARARTRPPRPLPTVSQQTGSARVDLGGPQLIGGVQHVSV